MELSKDNLILAHIKGSRYRFSYEPMGDMTAVGILDIDSETVTEGNNIDSPMFSDTTLSGIDFVKIKVWDVEGYAEISETEEAREFIKELKNLLIDELS